MVAESADKGTALERAVHAIEQAIFRASPNLAEKALRIEHRRILTINGVKREYDLYITVDIAPGYSAVYIFECKNWEEKVGPKEITDFAAKIKAANAAAGFFVAKSFTEYAEAEARLHPRLTLLHAIEHPINSSPFLALLQTSGKTPRTIELRLRVRGSGEYVQPSKNAPATSEGRTVDFDAILKEMRDVAMQADMQAVLDAGLPVGDHERTAEHIFEHGPGQLVVDGHDIERTDVRIRYIATVQQAVVESHFEVVSRGRVVTFTPLQFGNRKFRYQTILTRNVPVGEQPASPA